MTPVAKFLGQGSKGEDFSQKSVIEFFLFDFH